MDRIVLLASFIYKNKLDWFLNLLEKKHNIPKDKVFLYEMENDETKYLITYRFLIKDNVHVDFKSILPNALLVHKKGDAIYTINALNKLIELNHNESIGNINYKNIKIDWSEYQNKLILINTNKLNITTINRIFKD